MPKIRKRVLVLAGGLSLSLVVACPGSDLPSPDVAGCTAASLDAIRGPPCSFQLPGDILGTNCLDLPGATEAIDAGDYSVTACQNAMAGRLVTCIADNVAQCSYDVADGGTNTVPSQCEASINPDAPLPVGTCAVNCQNARTTCEAACPTTTAQACFQCSFNCGTTQVTCLSQCS